MNIIKYSERDKIMSFLHDVGAFAIGLMVIFHIFCDVEVSEKFPLRGLLFARLRLWPAASGGQHTVKSCVGGLSQVWKCCGGCKCPAHVSGVCPPPRTDGAAAGTGRGETDASVYTEWM